MRQLRISAPIVLLVVVAGCGSTPPSATPAPSPTPTPTAIGLRSPSTAAPTVQPPTVPPGLSLELACGGTVSTAIIDYADDPSGPLDIVGATRAMRGVRPTDIVAIDGTSTVVVRDGRVIWRGSWSPGASGFYLGGYSACEEGRGIGIGG